MSNTGKSQQYYVLYVLILYYVLIQIILIQELHIYIILQIHSGSQWNRVRLVVHLSIFGSKWWWTRVSRSGCAERARVKRVTTLPKIKQSLSIHHSAEVTKDKAGTLSPRWHLTVRITIYYYCTIIIYILLLTYIQAYYFLTGAGPERYYVLYVLILY